MERIYRSRTCKAHIDDKSIQAILAWLESALSAKCTTDFSEIKQVTSTSSTTSPCTSLSLTSNPAQSRPARCYRCITLGWFKSTTTKGGEKKEGPAAGKERIQDRAQEVQTYKVVMGIPEDIVGA